MQAIIGAQAHDVSLSHWRTRQSEETRGARRAHLHLRGRRRRVGKTRQQAVIAEPFPLFWESPAVAGITFWGYVDGATWKSRRPDSRRCLHPSAWPIDACVGR